MTLRPFEVTQWYSQNFADAFTHVAKQVHSATWLYVAVQLFENWSNKFLHGFAEFFGLNEVFNVERVQNAKLYRQTLVKPMKWEPSNVSTDNTRKEIRPVTLAVISKSRQQPDSILAERISKSWKFFHLDYHSDSFLPTLKKTNIFCEKLRGFLMCCKLMLRANCLWRVAGLFPMFCKLIPCANILWILATCGCFYSAKYKHCKI